jgi:thioesterase domain-containing protein
MSYSANDSQVADLADVTNQRVKALANAAFGREVTRKVTDAILPLSDVGNGRAFFCVHSVTGCATDFSELAQMLSPTYRFYGIQAPTAKRNAAFAASIARMSEFYTNRLNEFQPTGPLILGGHSTGALIALEMAHQLRALGREVSMLVVLDGHLFNTSAKPGVLYLLKLAANVPARMCQILEKSRTLYRNSPFSLLGKIRSSIAVLISNVTGHKFKTTINLRNFTPEHAAFVETLCQTHLDYIPQKYAGPVVVCAAQAQPLLELARVEVGWRRIAPAAEIVRFDATHTSLVHAESGAAVAEYLKKTFAKLDHKRAADAVMPSAVLRHPQPQSSVIDYRADRQRISKAARQERPGGL